MSALCFKPLSDELVHKERVAVAHFSAPCDEFAVQLFIGMLEHLRDERCDRGCGKFLYLMLEQAGLSARVSEMRIGYS